MNAIWVEPGTRQPYPISYPEYRRARELEEKRPPRHRTLGFDVDRYVARRWREGLPAEMDVVLTFHPDAPVRIRRIVAEILRAIRRGAPAAEAIRRVANRFGLRHGRARAFLVACVQFETRPRHDGLSPAGTGHWSPGSALGDWT
jgi:hypothetical protein